jgi:two-component system, cell cycle sensor histidine kinase and response regulator CckA
MSHGEGEAARACGAATRKDIASVLRNNAQMVEALLASASQAIISMDKSGRIVLANARTQEVFGYSAQELMGEQIEILLPDASKGRHEKLRSDYFRHPRVRPMGIGIELAGRRKNGAEFPVEVSLSFVRTEEGMFAIAFVTDISQRKNLEEQLMHAQKMEAVGRLAGGVAHDFNNMLTVIAGYNQMMLDHLSPLDPVRGYAEEVLKAADRAAALTGQLLAFSRRQAVQARVFNVNATLVNTEKMLRRLIGEDIELSLSLSSEVGNIKADPGHIEQAIFNLATNARDAMPGGGHLTIETASVYLDDTYAKTHLGVEPGRYVMIAVTDTGEGMDMDTKRRIFEPFFTTKEKGKGTGLGLATVYGIVKQAGGDIWVYSEKGRGTTFKLYFPFIAQPALESAGANASRPVAGSETILVVEDEQVVRELTAKMLKRMGYSVLTAASGPDALELVRQHPGEIAMLLTDVIMPNMNGMQLAEELRRLRPEVKVVYVSGYTENTIGHHCSTDDGAAFIAKPFNREELGRKVRSVLGKIR